MYSGVEGSWEGADGAGEGEGDSFESRSILPLSKIETLSMIHVVEKHVLRTRAMLTTMSQNEQQKCR